MLKKIRLILFMTVVSVVSLSAQAYLKDLEAGNVDKVKKKLEILGSSIDKEPVLSVYLDKNGADPGVVKALINSGADMNMAPSHYGRTPLNAAVEARQSPEIISMLLENGARIDMPFIVYNGMNIIDYALRKAEYVNAAVLLKYNNTLPPAKRVKVDKRYYEESVILTDNIAAARKIIADGVFREPSLWELAVCGNSREVLKLLSVLYEEPEMNNDTLEILLNNPGLMKYLLSLNVSFLSNASDYKKEEAWDVCIKSGDEELAVLLLESNPEVPESVLVSLAADQPDLFITLTSNGLKLKNTGNLWRSVIGTGSEDVFRALLAAGEAPDNIMRSAIKYGDGQFLNLLSAGYDVKGHDIPWEDLIKNGFEKSVAYLAEEGYSVPSNLVLSSLAYNENIFLSIVSKNSGLTRKVLGSETVQLKRGDNPRLIIDVAVEKGYLKAFNKIDEYFNVFDYDPSYKNPVKYPRAQGKRKALAYYDVIRKGDKRGYGPDGYNDFMTNNFNALVFLIAVKNSQREIAEYVLSRDSSVPDTYIFSNNAMIGESQYRYKVRDFVKSVYGNSSCADLVM